MATYRALLRTPVRSNPLASSVEISDLKETITRLQCELIDWKTRYHDLYQECTVLRSQNRRLQELYARAQSVNAQLLLTKIADRQRAHRLDASRTSTRSQKARTKPDLPSCARGGRHSISKSLTEGQPVSTGGETYFDPEEDLAETEVASTTSRGRKGSLCDGDDDATLDGGSTETQGEDACGQRLLRLAEAMNLGEVSKLQERIQQLEELVQTKNQEIADLMGSMRHQQVSSLRSQLMAQANTIQVLKEQLSRLQEDRSAEPILALASQGRPLIEQKDTLTGDSLSPSKTCEGHPQISTPEGEDPKPKLPERYKTQPNAQPQSSLNMSSASHHHDYSTSPMPPSARGLNASGSSSARRDKMKVLNAQAFAKRLALLEEENEGLRRALARSKQKSGALSQSHHTSHPKELSSRHHICDLVEFEECDAFSFDVDIDGGDVPKLGFATAEPESDSAQEEGGPTVRRTNHQSSASLHASKSKTISHPLLSKSTSKLLQTTKTSDQDKGPSSFDRYIPTDDHLAMLSDFASVSPSQTTLRNTRIPGYMRPKSATVRRPEENRNECTPASRPSRPSSAAHSALRPMPAELRARLGSHYDLTSTFIR